MPKPNTRFLQEGDGMSEPDAVIAFKELKKTLKFVSKAGEDLSKRYPKNHRPKFIGTVFKFFNGSELKKVQVSNYDLDKAVTTEDLVRKNPPHELFYKENNKFVQDVKNSLKKFKDAYPNWKTNPHLKLKVEFLGEVIALYIADQLCHKSDDLFKKYEKEFKLLESPHLANEEKE